MGLMPGNSGVLDINLEGRIHCRVVGWYSLLGGWVGGFALCQGKGRMFRRHPY